MDFFISDRFRLRVFQVLIALVFLAISLPAPVLIGLDLARHVHCDGPNCMRDMAETFGVPLMRLLAVPVDHVVGQYAAVFAVAFPAIVGIVCYKVDFSTTPPKASDALNVLGKAATVGLIVSVVLSVVVTVLFALDLPTMLVLAENDQDITSATKAVFTGILSFQFLYLLKLLGVRNEPKGS